MIGFAVPLGLLALLSIAVPILIHLRRKPLRPIPVGTIRHLEGAAPRPRLAPRASELLLLLLRVLLLALAAAAVAEPFLLNASPPRRPRAVTVAADSASDVWSLLRHLDDTLPAGSSILLDVPGRVTVSGRRPALASRVTIRQPALGAPAPFTPSGRRREVVIAAPPERREVARHFAAAFGAVAAARGDSLEVHESAETRSSVTRWVIWLADSGRARAEALARAGAIVVTESPGRAHEGVPVGATRPAVYARPAGHGVVYELDGRFDGDGASLVESGALPAFVASIWPDDAAPGRAARVRASQLQPEQRAGARGETRVSLALPLLVAAFALLIAERFLAHRGLGRPRVTT